MDTICFNATQFPCKWVWLDDAEYEGCWLVATESLERQLLDSSWNYVSYEAQLVDETIFFYVPDDIIWLDEDRVSDFILKNL